jgi:hypothetical protein
MQGSEDSYRAIFHGKTQSVMGWKMPQLFCDVGLQPLRKLRQTIAPLVCLSLSSRTAWNSGNVSRVLTRESSSYKIQSSCTWTAAQVAARKNWRGDSCTLFRNCTSYPGQNALLVQAVHSLHLQVQFLSPQVSKRDVTNILQSVAQMICRLTIGFQRDYGDPSASMCSACSVCVKSPKSRLAADGATYKVYGVRRHTLFFATRYLVRFVRLCGGCGLTQQQM